MFSTNRAISLNTERKLRHFSLKNPKKVAQSLELFNCNIRPLYVYVKLLR